MFKGNWFKETTNIPQQMKLSYLSNTEEIHCVCRIFGEDLLFVLNETRAFTLLSIMIVESTLLSKYVKHG